MIRLRKAGAARAVGGFSLLEMAVVLVIMGLVGALLWQVLPRLQSASVPEPVAGGGVACGQRCTVGFALANSRLPCPDTDDDGLEDCAVTDAVGHLPQRTIGQLYARPIRYGVNRLAASDLTVASDRYVPNIPGTAPAIAPINALTCCRHPHSAGIGAFRAAGRGASDPSPLHWPAVAPPTPLAMATCSTASTPVATSPRPTVPLPPATTTSPRRWASVNSHNAWLPQPPAEANGAAKSAVAARDLYNMAAFYKDFRHFANVGTRAVDIDMAIFSVALATADTIIAGAQLAISIAETAESAGAAAFAIAIATVALADAVANLALAVIGLQDAQDAKVTAEEQDARDHHHAAVTLPGRDRPHACARAKTQWGCCMKKNAGYT